MKQVTLYQHTVFEIFHTSHEADHHESMRQTSSENIKTYKNSHETIVIMYLKKHLILQTYIFTIAGPEIIMHHLDKCD